MRFNKILKLVKKKISSKKCFPIKKKTAKKILQRGDFWD